jgi:hypothetical protein
VLLEQHRATLGPPPLTSGRMSVIFTYFEDSTNFESNEIYRISVVLNLYYYNASTSSLSRALSALSRSPVSRVEVPLELSLFDLLSIYVDYVGLNEF